MIRPVSFDEACEALRAATDALNGREASVRILSDGRVYLTIETRGGIVLRSERADTTLDREVGAFPSEALATLMDLPPT